MPRRLNEIPDPVEAFNNYSEAVCSGEAEILALLRAEISRIFTGTTGEPLSHNQIVKRLNAWIISAKSRVGQISESSVFDTHQTKGVKSFEEFRRCTAKSVQEVLCSPQDRVLLPKDASLNNIVIDPRNLTDSALRAFGFEEYCGKSLEEKASAIPHIKDFLSTSLEPLELENHRMYHIKSGKNAGKILGVQQNGDKDIFFLIDLHGAFRRVDHIRQKHENEIAQLIRIDMKIKEIVKRVYDNWGELKEDDEELNKIKETLLGFIAELKFVKNEEKRKIRSKLIRSFTFKDKKQRDNPMAALAIINPIGNLVHKRLVSINGMSGHIKHDRNEIFATLQRETNWLERFLELIEKKESKLYILDLDLEIDGVRRKKINGNLNFFIKICESLEFEPYRGIAQKIKRELETSLEFIANPQCDRNGREEAKMAFLRAYSLTKLLHLENKLLNIYTRYFNDGFKAFRQGPFIRDFAALFSEFAGKKVQPDVQINDFSSIYSAIIVEMRGISKKSKMKLDEDGYKELKGLFEKLSVSEILQVQTPRTEPDSETLPRTPETLS